MDDGREGEMAPAAGATARPAATAAFLCLIKSNLSRSSSRGPVMGAGLNRARMRSLSFVQWAAQRRDSIGTE